MAHREVYFRGGDQYPKWGVDEQAMNDEGATGMKLVAHVQDELEAHRIAALPDMLAALEDCAGVIEALLPMCPKKCHVLTTWKYAKVHAKDARAAIAKAAGHEWDSPEPDVDDSVKCCPDCERPNQFGELCPTCAREQAEEEMAALEGRDGA